MTLEHDGHAQLSEVTSAHGEHTEARTWNWTLTQRHRARSKGRFLRALRAHGTIAAACRASGVGRTTVYEWMREYPAFMSAVESAQAEAEEMLVSSLMTRALNPEDRTGEKAAEFLLRAINPDKFGDRVTVNQQVTINHNVQVVHQLRAAQQDKLRQLTLGNVIDVQALPVGDDERTA